MGFLIAAARSESSEELKDALQSVRVLGSVRQSGDWWWAIIFYLHFKELDHALKAYDGYSFSAYAGDSVWKLSLFAPNQTAFSIWFDASLAAQRGVEKAKVSYEGRPIQLAQRFGLSEDKRELIRQFTFERAVSQLLDWQIEAILDAFQRYSIPHDPASIREILLNPSSEELDSEIGNLPRFLEAIGLRGLLD